MDHHYVWLFWSSAFLVPWIALFVLNPNLRGAMWRTSAVTALFGLIEPIFVPEYWNPPSLFELARRTGFDIESLLFAFAVGGIGCVLYDSIARQHLVSVSAAERGAPLHEFHLAALLIPPVLFVPLYLLPWNPIYAVLTSLLLGVIASVLCRPTLARRTVVGAFLFLGLYGVFMLGLRLGAPGYIAEVWNLPALRWGVVLGIPIEELAFGFVFGAYWTGVYEHFTWRESVPYGTGRARRTAAPGSSGPTGSGAALHPSARCEGLNGGLRPLHISP
jgi:hypothetical protein